MRGGEDDPPPKQCVQQLGAGALSRDGGERAQVDGGAPPAAEPGTSRSSWVQADGSVGGACECGSGRQEAAPSAAGPAADDACDERCGGEWGGEHGGERRRVVCADGEHLGSGGELD
eukprot:618097-Pleurochrysis_carterae.AAC.1